MALKLSVVTAVLTLPMLCSAETVNDSSVGMKEMHSAINAALEESATSLFPVEKAANQSAEVVGLHNPADAVAPGETTSLPLTESGINPSHSPAEAIDLKNAANSIIPKEKTSPQPVSSPSLESKLSSPVETAVLPSISEPVAQKEKSNSYALPSEQPPSTSQLNQRVQIGGNYTYAWIGPDGNKTTRGNLGGAQGIYEYRPLGSVYAGAAFSYRIGKTTNDSGSRTLQDFNPQARVGYTFPTIDLLNRFTLFTGFGGRYMAEKVDVGSASLDFAYTTFYAPLGFLFEQKVVEHFLIGCNFQWMPQVLPMVRIDLLDGAQWDLTYQLANFFVEVPFILSLYNDRFTLSISPFFESWRDGKSKAETLTHLRLALPGNKYIFTGVNVNFGFSY